MSRVIVYASRDPGINYWPKRHWEKMFVRNTEFHITADVPFVLGNDFPGKIWFIILRLYGPLQPWLDQVWQPGEIELVK